MTTPQNTLSVRLTSRKTETETYFEGTVSIQGLRPTKLARRADGSTQFSTKSAVSGAARNLARSLGYTDICVTDANAPKTPCKAAAKKSVTRPAIAVAKQK